MAGRQQRVLTDHEEIRRWAEERGASPSCVRGTGGGGDVGMLRLDFPGYSGETSLEHIEWEEWLPKFDENNLALLVEDTTARGQKSNFNKIISRETADEMQSGRRSSGSARRGTGRGGSAKKAAGKAAGNRGGGGSARKGASKKSAVKKAGVAKKAASKKSAGKKASGGKKATGKKSAAKKATGKKATGRKASGGGGGRGGAKRARGR